ncbi:Fe-S oxidoreductase [Desulfosporosinus sp. HMP52]|uniref:heterodisulfide reductase-related iron-sulfur binding cluster n=1 Tax=Desulfosporosinus sp. HMP52 TaxID=1487923 RepID=UPI00051FA1B6|nr:heterodisulfide reductase-related iron-sulfur binding cluster [Desulfosporosinus sp. HMP52]KGK86529.1 Fe-S oxidoreductase [Desulfosporosinus sp. HMP52]
MEATRQLYWNIDGKSTMYAFALITLVVFTIGTINKIRGWQQGKALAFDNLSLRLREFISTMARHDQGVFRGDFRRYAHLGIFYGFIVLTFGTLVIAIQDHFGIPLFYGMKYLVLSLLLDLFGLMAMVGILMAAYKRYIDKPDHEDYTLDDALLLIIVFTILLTGFFLEGLRIYSVYDPWAWWSPVGLFFALMIQLSGISTDLSLAVHAFIWYFHMLLTFGFIAYIPYSKLFHMFASPLNIFLKSNSPIGTLTPVDCLTEDQKRVGAGYYNEFSKKQLLELDACISCGRCQKGCPAHLSGRPLSPRVLVQTLKKHSKKKATTLINQVISQETLWSCTTCGLCEVKCPIYIEHIKRIVDLRRGLTSSDIGFPEEIQSVLNNISESGNPWGNNVRSVFPNLELASSPQQSEKKQMDVLYWLGCYGSYQPRNQKVSQSMITILEKAGIDYGVLGGKEKCCGDSVRRLGNEKLFQQLAYENVKTLNDYKFKTILTHCPHCFNTLKNDYPQFGGSYQVMHHSEYILELIRSERIILKKSNGSKVTFHDPCYLGRYNQVYNAPREVLNAIPGLELLEMKNNQGMAFCCGSGGGNIWMGNKGDKKIHSLLVKKATRTEADILVSACSLCLKTLSEAVSSKSVDMQSKDIAELVADAL